MLKSFNPSSPSLQINSIARCIELERVEAWSLQMRIKWRRLIARFSLCCSCRQLTHWPTWCSVHPFDFAQDTVQRRHHSLDWAMIAAPPSTRTTVSIHFNTDFRLLFGVPSCRSCPRNAIFDKVVVAGNERGCVSISWRRWGKMSCGTSSKNSRSTRHAMYAKRSTALLTPFSFFLSRYCMFVFPSAETICKLLNDHSIFVQACVLEFLKVAQDKQDRL